MSALAGKRILIVEDEPIVAMCLEDMLIELGCEVIGPAATLAAGLAAAESSEFDAAVLDINLGDADSLPIARLLVGRDVPIVFATGYGRGGAGADAVADAELIGKPYTRAQIAAALERVVR